MPVFSVAATLVAPAAAAPYSTFHTVAARRAFLREIHYSTSTAVYSPVGIIYPNNAPAGTTSFVPVAHDTNDAASTALLDTAWAVTPPTIGANVFLRKDDLGPAQGQILIQTFPLDGQGKITIAKSTYIVFWNYGGNPAAVLDQTIIYEE